MTWEVVLHIGAPKSGSSAIQRFCLANRETLLHSGYYYPVHEMDPNEVTSGHIQVALSLLKGQAKDAGKAFQRHLREAGKASLPLLLSSEAFFRLPAETRELTKGLSVRIVAFVRHPVESLVSGHNQGIKRAFRTRSLGDHCKTVALRENVQHVGQVLNQWADNFGDANCLFLPYQTDRYRERSLELDFLAALDIDKQHFPAFALDHKRVNRSYVAEALELKRLLNTVMTRQDVGLNQQMDLFLQAYSDSAPVDDNSGTATLPSTLLQQLQITYAGPMIELGERFPRLKNTFGHLTSGHEQVPDRRRHHRLIDLLDLLFTQHPNLEELICERVKRHLHQGAQSAALLKLADLLGFDPGFEIDLDSLLPESRRQRLLDETNQPADYLRELALMFEVAGDLDNALRFIDRALSLRPEGELIRRIRERIVQKQRQFT